MDLINFWVLFSLAIGIVCGYTIGFRVGVDRVCRNVGKSKRKYQHIIDFYRQK